MITIWILIATFSILKRIFFFDYVWYQSNCISESYFGQFFPSKIMFLFYDDEWSPSNLKGWQLWIVQQYHKQLQHLQKKDTLKCGKWSSNAKRHRTDNKTEINALIPFTSFLFWFLFKDSPSVTPYYLWFNYMYLFDLWSIMCCQK